jgi:hypothetical protein
MPNPAKALAAWLEEVRLSLHAPYFASPPYSFAAFRRGGAPPGSDGPVSSSSRIGNGGLSPPGAVSLPGRVRQGFSSTIGSA